MSEQTLMTLSSQYLSTTSLTRVQSRRRQNDLTVFKKELQTDDHVIPLDSAVSK